MTTTNSTARSYCVLSDNRGGFYSWPEDILNVPSFTVYRSGLASRSQAERVAIRLEREYDKRTKGEMNHE